MRDGIMLTVDEDGTARVYDDTYDIVIHCESQEEQDEAMEKLRGMTWVPCSKRLPKDGEEVFVYLFDRPSPYIAWIEDSRWYTEEFEVDREYEPLAWMPLPECYRGEEK